MASECGISSAPQNQLFSWPRVSPRLKLAEDGVTLKNSESSYARPALGHSSIVSRADKAP